MNFVADRGRRGADSPMAQVDRERGLGQWGQSGKLYTEGGDPSEITQEHSTPPPPPLCGFLFVLPLVAPAMHMRSPRPLLRRMQPFPPPTSNTWHAQSTHEGRRRSGPAWPSAHCGWSTGTTVQSLGVRPWRAASYTHWTATSRRSWCSKWGRQRSPPPPPPRGNTLLCAVVLSPLRPMPSSSLLCLCTPARVRSA